jgi:hypothetical protein
MHFRQKKRAEAPVPDLLQERYPLKANSHIFHLRRAFIDLLNVFIFDRARKLGQES